MKTYNKPEILIENISVEDILAVSVGGAFNDWNAEGTGSTFDDLWGSN